VIEERALAVGRRLELLQEPAEQLDLIRVDLDQRVDALGLVAVMGQRVVRFADPEPGKHALAGVAAHHEAEHAREIGRVGQRQQVELEHRVLLEVLGNADRRGRQRDVGGGLLSARWMPALDLADVFEVVAQTLAIARPEPAASRVTDSATESRMLRSCCIRCTRVRLVDRRRTSARRASGD
jgi:hypothetical protein